MQYLDLSAYPDRCVVCGDIHGDFALLVDDISRWGISDAIVLIAGDCGFGFERPNFYDDLYRRKMHKQLAKARVLLLMVRGNHDDPLYFEKEVIDYPHLKTIPDYTIVHTPSHNILCVGGAVSEDRRLRITMAALSKKMPTWWEDEPFVYKEEELSVMEEEHILIDTVVTHTCSPLLASAANKADFVHFCANDDHLEADVLKESRDIKALYDWLTAHGHPLHDWYYGHYHSSATTNYAGVLFHQLNNNEMKEIHRTL